MHVIMRSQRFESRRQHPYKIDLKRTHQQNTIEIKKLANKTSK